MIIGASCGFGLLRSASLAKHGGRLLATISDMNQQEKLEVPETPHPKYVVGKDAK